MTHLDMLKHIVEEDPWEIAHRLFSCMECPKLAKCNILLNRDLSKHTLVHPSSEDQKKVCKICINEWLNEEIVQPEETDLPTTVTVNVNELDYDEEYDEIDDVLGDYLSDKYGFCHNGFCFEKNDKTGDIIITDIDWDEDE